MPKISIKKVDYIPKIFNKKTIYLDIEKLKGKISIRKWRIGDRIKPIGVNGSKLISDILTNAKVANHNRSNNWLIVDEEKIIACIDYCIDRRAIANQNTKHIICLEIIY